MKKMVKSAVVALALALSLSFGVGTTANAKVTVKKVASVNKLTGSKKITLTKGKKATLKTTVTLKSGKTNKKVTYKSSKKSVATVTKKGVIKAKKVGTAKITVTSTQNKKKKATVTVKVVKGKVTKVTFDQTAIRLDPAKTAEIKATVKTSGKKPNKALVWSTSDAKVATVTAAGKVTAVAPGVATITAKATDGTGKKATATVTVSKTTLALGSAASFKADVELDATKAATDFEALVKAAGLKDTDSVSLTINARTAETTKTVAQAREYLKTNKATKVTLTVKAAQAKKFSPAALALTSVKSLTVGGVKFTDITATSLKIDGVAFDYTVEGANVVVNGDITANASVKKLVDAKVIAATLN